jgi:hypothetical protein
MLAVIRKEFLLAIRDRLAIGIIFMMPMTIAGLNFKEKMA